MSTHNMLLWRKKKNIHVYVFVVENSVLSEGLQRNFIDLTV